jgi:hypothetical protein
MSIVVVQEKGRKETSKAATEALSRRSCLFVVKNMKDSVSEAVKITITESVTF